MLVVCCSDIRYSDRNVSDYIIVTLDTVIVMLVICYSNISYSCRNVSEML